MSHTGLRQAQPERLPAQPERSQKIRGFSPALGHSPRAFSRAGGCGSAAQAHGFTLLEVLIAVLILALALVALVRTTTLEARALAQVRDATLAQWVAANAIAEARLGDGVPASGRRNGTSMMGDRRWRWRLDASATEEPSIQRLEVAVYVDDAGAEARDEAVARLTGFAWR